ncbi:MAG: ATP-binding protein [Reichenbachiella sp.]|uniref:ATP-binding protein n=1 Tax=Reichenbachiella sp. TaxID=2184521 RepID=UPI002966FB95|nr:ATP-binding protein [Reichenbachiella sp.]MDW3209514.1 ATP-binding protein [Reichenbachiella sp.]
MENPRLIQTNNLKKGIELLDEAKLENKLYYFVGGTGIGKTTIFNYYQRTHPDTLVTNIKPAEPASYFYAKLLCQISGEDFSLIFNNSQKRIHNFIEEASFEILEKTQIKLLIIDEIGNFKRQFIPYLRQISDNISHKCGIILASPPDFKDRLLYWSNKGVPGISEVLTRINYTHEFLSPSFDDIQKLCVSYNISRKKVWHWIYRNSDNMRTAINYIIAYLNGRLEI